MWKYSQCPGKLVKINHWKLFILESLYNDKEHCIYLRQTFSVEWLHHKTHNKGTHWIMFLGWVSYPNRPHELCQFCSHLPPTPCISGNLEIYFKNFLLFSVLGGVCEAAALVHCQGRMKTRTNHVSVWLCVCSGGGVWVSTAMCAPLFAFEFACASMRIFFHVWMCVCVCLSQTLGFWVCLYFGEQSVCFHAAGQGGLVSLSIDTAAQFRLLMGWCDKDFFFPQRFWVCVAADQCGSNHPTGAV